MPAPSSVTFTPFVDIYGMLSIKDIAVEDWGDADQKRGSLNDVPTIPLRTPMFNSRVSASGDDSAGIGAINPGIKVIDLGSPAGASRRDVPIESGANLTRTWVIFLEKILKLLRGKITTAQRARKLHAVLCWIDETETRDIWATVGAVDAVTDPLVIATPGLSTPRTTIPPYAEPWAVGDYVVWNDPARGTSFSGTVSFAGTDVTWVSGALFDTSMVGNPITLGTSVYTVLTVQPDGKKLTINADAGGIQSGVSYSVSSFLRRYECGQVVAVDATTGATTIRRHWPQSMPGNRATFESYMESHGFGIRLYRVKTSLFTYEMKANSFLTDGNTDTTFTFLPSDTRNRYSGIPRRWDITLPHAAVVAVYVAAENDAGLGPWAGVNTSYGWADTDTKVPQHPPAPGLRTHVGASYWFEEPGDIVARTRPNGAGGTISTLNFYPTLPIRIQDWATIRTMYGFVGKPAVTPATDEPLKVRMKVLLAADRIDGKALYDPAQPWQDWEDLIWEKVGNIPCISNADKGGSLSLNSSAVWTTSQANPPTQRRMPYCAQGFFYWDPENIAIPPKAWPVPVMEADAWLTFDVLVATVGSDAKPPADLTVVIQT